MLQNKIVKKLDEKAAQIEASQWHVEVLKGLKEEQNGGVTHYEIAVLMQMCMFRLIEFCVSPYKHDPIK